MRIELSDYSYFYVRIYLKTHFSEDLFVYILPPLNFFGLSLISRPWCQKRIFLLLFTEKTVKVSIGLSLDFSVTLQYINDVFERAYEYKLYVLLGHCLLRSSL